MRVMVMVILLLLLEAFPGEATARQLPRATQLFQEARALMQQRRFAEACPKLEESFRLSPAVGTALNTARCHDEAGRLASALEWYQRSASMAAASKQQDRESFARQQITRLEKEAPRVIVHIDTPIDKLALFLDDKRFAGNQLRRIDAGSYELRAEAPGHRPFATSLVAENGKVTTLELPALAAEAEIEAEPDEPTRAASLRSTDRRRSLSKQRKASYLVGASGTAALLTGLGFGLAARSAWKDARAACPEGERACPDTATARADTAATRANVATALCTLGAASIGAAVLLWLTDDRHEPRRRTTLIPAAGPSEVGVVLTRSF